MATEQEVLDDLIQAITNTNTSNDDFLKVLKEGRDQDVALRDGTVVPSLTKRVVNAFSNSDYLMRADNLASVVDKQEARDNLNVPTKEDVLTATEQATETEKGTAKIATTAIAQAGVNDTDFITALKLANTRQSVWVNKTGMLFGTTYMNTARYEKEISFLSVFVSGLVLTAKVTFKNLTTNIETIVYFGCVSNWTGGIASSANFVVPPNTSFKIEIVRTDSLSTVVTLEVDQWSERYYV